VQIRALWSARFNLPPNDERFSRLTPRQALEQLALCGAYDEIRNEAAAERERIAREARLYGNDADVSPEVLAKRAGPVLTGASASKLADVPIVTGDAVVDEWEREEFEDTSPIKWVDGPATHSQSPSKLLARYIAPR
jgi:hypothetical protein